jgi:uncharacterized protein YjiS (DUF1127 family)
MTWFTSSVARFAWLAVVGRAVGALFRQISHVLTVLEHRREVRHLAELDERILKDIGLSRSDVESALLEPVFRNPSVLLVRSVERRNRVQAMPSERRTVRPTVPVTQGARS